MMNEEIIRKYAQLMKELELTGLEVKDGETCVRLERGGVPVAPALEIPAVPSQPVSSVSDEGADRITSPMVGVFYAAPAENAEPFVKVGDSVKKGDTLCIIEAMKLMNEVVAEKDGVIKEICVKNAQTVEYGTVLFLIGA